jgi:hypothetical protein
MEVKDMYLTIRRGINAFLSIIFFMSLFISSAFGQTNEIITIGRILSDKTIFNHEVTVSGTVEDVEVNPGSTRGQFILRDTTGQTIRVKTDRVPQQASTITIRGHVRSGSRGTYLWQIFDVPRPPPKSPLWWKDPIYLIAAAFLLVMGFLIYFLFRSEKKATTTGTIYEPTSKEQVGPVSYGPVVEPVKPEPEIPPRPVKRTEDVYGVLVVKGSSKDELVGTEIYLAGIEGRGKLLGNGATLNVGDPTFSRQSGQVSIDPVGAINLTNVSRKRNLNVTSSKGARQTLTPGEVITLEDGDVIEQEKSAINLEFKRFGPKTIDY